MLSCTALVQLKESPKEKAISAPWHCGIAARQKFPSSGKFQYFYSFILLSFGLQRIEISQVYLVWGFPVLSVGKTSPMFRKQWNASLWVSSVLKGISVRLSLILGCCHLCYPPDPVFFWNWTSFLGYLSYDSLFSSGYRTIFCIIESTDWMAGPEKCRVIFPAMERSVLQSYCARLQSWCLHSIIPILLSAHNCFCHLQTLHIHAVTPIALVSKLEKYLQSSFQWDKELEFKERWASSWWPSPLQMSRHFWCSSRFESRVCLEVRFTHCACGSLERQTPAESTHGLLYSGNWWPVRKVTCRNMEGIPMCITNFIISIK